MNYWVHCYDKETAAIVLAFCQQREGWSDVRYIPPDNEYNWAWNHSVAWESEDTTIGYGHIEHPVMVYLMQLNRLNKEGKHYMMVNFFY